MSNYVISAARRLLEFCGDHLLPQDCFLCGAASGKTPLCPGCRASLPALGDACCPVCALPGTTDRVCGACLAEAPHFDASHALFRYDFPVDRLIHAFKYGQRLAIGAWFAQRLAEQSGVEADLILPLPLSAARLRERGFNQSVELARAVARRHGLPLALHTCQRRHHDVPQSRLPWKARRKNVRHAFECHVDLHDKRILVIDDVMTTGATLNELARMLKAHGANRVTNLVIARAVKK